MDETETLTALVAYYVNLLIIQYSQQPKAQATIALLIDVLLANAVFLDVLNGYDIETAVGVQLDVLGKYANVDRYYSAEVLQDYFAFTDYSDPDPDSEPKYGFSTYASFGGYNFNGTLTYSEIAPTKNTLSDDNFRQVIKLAIIQNTNNFSHGQIDAAIAGLFGSTLRAESNNDMKMWYFVTGAFTPVIQAAIAKNLLPKPMGVSMGIAGTSSFGVFAFTDYSGITPTFAGGFSDYADYATLAGQILTYDVLQEGL